MNEAATAKPGDAIVGNAAADAPKKKAPVRDAMVRARTRKPAIPDIATRARCYTEAALAAFVAVMQDANAPAAARVAAATQVLTWGYGKNAGGESETGERTVRLAWEG